MSKAETVPEKHRQADAPMKEPAARRSTYSPSVDIIETQDALRVLADMPGVSSENIDIHFENGELTIHGRVKDHQAQNQQYLLQEYGTGDFFRAFRISEEINAEKIHAEYKDGVLILHLPKVEALKPRKIVVRPK